MLHADDPQPDDWNADLEIVPLHSADCCTHTVAATSRLEDALADGTIIRVETIDGPMYVIAPVAFRASDGEAMWQARLIAADEGSL